MEKAFQELERENAKLKKDLHDLTSTFDALRIAMIFHKDRRNRVKRFNQRLVTYTGISEQDWSRTGAQELL